MKKIEKKQAFYGPIIVAIANAMRAFDAPVRYPFLLSKLDWNEMGNLSEALRFSGFSSFVVTIEHIIGAIITIPLLLMRRGRRHLVEQLKKFDREDWFSLAFISVGSGLGLYFFLIALVMGNPTVAILIQKTQPLITLFVAMLLLKERPTRFYFVALAFSLIGLFLLIFSDITNPNVVFFELIAALASLVAAALWGSNTVFGRKLLEKDIDYWDLTTLRYIGGSIVLIFFNVIAFAYTAANFAALTETYPVFQLYAGPGNQIFAGIPVLGIICIIYATLLTGGIIPLALYYLGLRWSKASIAGLAELAFPLLAIFVNFIFLGWVLTSFQLLGAAIILVVMTTLSYINAKEHEAEL
ncbi:MAG: DMT family transporter [Candidatus Hodarchaeota archaeon]